MRGPMYYGINSRPIGRLEWVRQIEDRWQLVSHVGRGIWVSTVHLGLDHSFGYGPPLIFETMAFDREQRFNHREFEDLTCERYTTIEQAQAGHEVVARRAFSYAWNPLARLYLKKKEGWS